MKSTTGVRLNDREVLEALHINYDVDIHKGEIYSKRTGKPMFRFYARKVGSDERSTYPRICIKCKGRQSSRSLCKLIWMYSRNTVVPKDCEVHHLSTDHTDDSWDNLICIHKDDHRMIHWMLQGKNGSAPVERADSVGF